MGAVISGPTGSGPTSSGPTGTPGVDGVITRQAGVTRGAGEGLDHKCQERVLSLCRTVLLGMLNFRQFKFPVVAFRCACHAPGIVPPSRECRLFCAGPFSKAMMCGEHCPRTCVFSPGLKCLNSYAHVNPFVPVTCCMHCCKSLVCRLPPRRLRGRAVFVTWVITFNLLLNLPGVKDISALTRLDEGGVI